MCSRKKCKTKRVRMPIGHTGSKWPRHKPKHKLWDVNIKYKNGIQWAMTKREKDYVDALRSSGKGCFFRS